MNNIPTNTDDQNKMIKYLHAKYKQEEFCDTHSLTHSFIHSFIHSSSQRQTLNPQIFILSCHHW